MHICFFYFFIQEYLKQQELQEKGGKTASSLADPIPLKASESKAHLKIQKMMGDLFSKLDALSNFHYTPRMVCKYLYMCMFYIDECTHDKNYLHSFIGPLFVLVSLTLKYCSRYFCHT